MTYKTERNGTERNGTERRASGRDLGFRFRSQKPARWKREEIARGNAEMPRFNQGTTLEISRVIFSARRKQSRRLWNPLDTSSFRALRATLFRIRLARTIGTISESSDRFRSWWSSRRNDRPITRFTRDVSFEDESKMTIVAPFYLRQPRRSAIHPSKM